MSLPDERALIAELTEDLRSGRNRAGFVSDCAVVPLGEGELVATVDAFARSTHFPEGLPSAMAGRLAAGATLSDLAAAGAELLGVLAAYGVPAETDRDAIGDLAGAIAGRVERAGGEILGGDTKPRSELTVSLTALGTCPAGEAMTRQRARPGQRLVLTGPLGGAGAALDRIREGLDPSEADPLVPPDRLTAGRRLRAEGVRCAVDLSDGLAEAAVGLSRAADVAVHLEAEDVPLHGWARQASDGLAHALATGGDYELLAAVDPGDLDAVLASLRELDLSPTPVGRVEEGEGAWLHRAEGPEELHGGYEHRFDDG